MSRGFTLIELIVVIIIIAVMSGVIVPAYSRLAARTRFDSVVADVQDIFGYAREEAMARDTVVNLTYDPQSETFLVNAMATPPTSDLPVAALAEAGAESGAGAAANSPPAGNTPIRSVQLPPEYAVGNFSVQSDGSDSTQNGGRRTIRFQGDGTSDGAELIVAGMDGDTADLRLSPTTGRLALVSPQRRSPNQ